MANVFDYLKWRGDISTAQSPFCEIDALILSEISYIDFSRIITNSFDSEVTLKEASDIFFSDPDRYSKPLGLIMPDSIFHVFKAAASTRRFAEMKLISFISETSESESKQFSAIAVDTKDRFIFVAYRGTDDSIVGWKENFRMSYSDSIPAQLEAKKYLETVADHLPLPIRIGGHSKGGNLAMYASLNCVRSVREKITSVYCFDSPGFAKSFTETEEYIALGERIFTFVPENSIVGMMLRHDTNFKTVKSSASGLYQHDAFTWKVNVNTFDILPESSEYNKKSDKIINSWLDSMDSSQRQNFTETFFELLEVTGAKTLTDLSTGTLEKAKEMLTTLGNLDKEKKKMLTNSLSLLIKESLRQHSSKFKIKKEERSQL